MHSETDVAQLLAECAAAADFEELVAIAIREAKKFDGGCNIVCGPISTGGRGSIEKNLVVFEGTIRALSLVPYPMFDQTPYEKKISALRQAWIAEDPETRNGQYYQDILTRFYLPLFQSGAIVHAWFIPDWASSHGACWERKQFDSLSIGYTDLSQMWLEQFVISEE